MDIANKLQELTEETLHFGDIISHSKNPSDMDFRDACNLFSQYLSYQLDIISSKIRFNDIRPEMRLTNAQLCLLNDLITPESNTSRISSRTNHDDSYDWNSKVLNFFSQLQTLRKLAA